MKVNNIRSLTRMMQRAGWSGLFDPSVTVQYDKAPAMAPSDWRILFDHNADLQSRVDAAKRIGYKAGIAGWCLPFCDTPERVAQEVKDGGNGDKDLDILVTCRALVWLGLNHRQAHDLFDQRLGVTWRRAQVVLTDLMNTGQVNWAVAAGDGGYDVPVQRPDEEPQSHVFTGTLTHMDGPPAPGVQEQPADVPPAQHVPKVDPVTRLSEDWLEGYRAGKVVGEAQAERRHRSEVAANDRRITEEETIRLDENDGIWVERFQTYTRLNVGGNVIIIKQPAK